MWCFLIICRQRRSTKNSLSIRSKNKTITIKDIYSLALSGRLFYGEKNQKCSWSCQKKPKHWPMRRFRKNKETLYREVYRSSKEQLFKELQDDSKPTPYLHVFALLTKLKQICDHPALFKNEVDNYKKYASGKWDLFVELLNETRESGQKLVVFSQYLGMLDIIESYLKEHHIGFSGIRGSTRDRKEQVEKIPGRSEMRSFHRIASSCRRWDRFDLCISGDPLRSLVEPRKRKPSDRPCPPDGTEPRRSGL